MDFAEGPFGHAPAAFIDARVVAPLMPACAYCGTPLEAGHLAAVSSRPLVAFWAAGPDNREGLLSKIRWSGAIEFPGYHCPKCRTVLLYYSVAEKRP